MPYKPLKKQSHSAYMRSCVPSLESEGKIPTKAVEICNGVWYSNKSNKKNKTKRKK